MYDMRSTVEDMAEKFKERTAISYKVKPSDAEVVRKSYNDLRRDVRGLGTSFIKNGLRGRKIALVGENSYGWACTYYAVMAVNSVLVPVDKDLSAEDIAGIISVSDCEAVIFGEMAKAKVGQIRDTLPNVRYWYGINEDLPALMADGDAAYRAGDNSYYEEKTDPDALASIVFTSGTTGKGKGVMLSQRNILMDMVLGEYNFSITHKTLFVLPPHHTFGSTVIYVGHVPQGCEVYITSGLKHIGEEMLEQRPTSLILVPAFLELMNKKIWEDARKSGKAGLLKSLMAVSNFLLKFGIDLRGPLFKSVRCAFGGRVRQIICGGAKLGNDVIRTFESIGITVMNGYGITECAPLISCNRNFYQKKGSVGVPILLEDIKILNPDEYGDGEICVKGPNVMLGYYGNPEATAEAFTPDGYFRTGDYGHLDEEGWVYITGRLKNLIILSNGKNVYPEEIEAEIKSVKGVAEVVVYEGKSDKRACKDLVVAEIFPDGKEIEQLSAGQPDFDAKKYFNAEIAKLNKRMPPYKAVRMVRLRDTEFEKNTSKKIKRFAIDKNID